MVISWHQIQTEISTLKGIEPKVRRYTYFGDDNRAAVRAQIAVLENILTEQEIYEQGWSDHEENSAQDALAWMLGDEPVPPSESWADLVMG